MIKTISKLGLWRPIVLRTRLRLITTFLVGQGAVQAINVISGIFLIRWMTIEDYAQFSLAFAFQSTAQTLVELGLSGAVIALVGSRIYDKSLIGDFIKAVKYYRTRLFVVIGACCIVAFPLATMNHNWPNYVTILLLCSILFNLFVSGNSSFYLSPLQMHRKIKELYTIQFKTSVSRLLFLCILTVFSALNAWIVAFLSAIVVYFNGRTYKKESYALIDEPAFASNDSKQKVFRYVKPVMPGIIYSAFSGQIALFIISIFGSTRSIAEVGALSRLGQMFLILTAASSTLVVPYLAKQSASRVRQKYLAIITFATVFSFVITLVSFMFPQILVWIIGGKYAHLEKEVGLLVLNSCISLLNALMWDMNCSRKWLWSWIPVVSIGSNILIQIGLIWGMSLDTTYNVLLFSIFLSIGNLINKIVVAYLGFYKLNYETSILHAKQ